MELDDDFDGWAHYASAREDWSFSLGDQDGTGTLPGMPHNAMFAALARLMGSSKAIVVLAITIGTFAAVHWNKAAFGEATEFLKWVLGPWLLAQGVEDAAKHYGNSKVEASKNSIAPPAK